MSAELSRGERESVRDAIASWVLDSDIDTLYDAVDTAVQQIVDQREKTLREGEHPDLKRLREQVARAVEHGYTEGDVNHNVQPIIGHLRVAIQDGGGVDRDYLPHVVEALTAACDAETAWLNSVAAARAEGATEALSEFERLMNRATHDTLLVTWNQLAELVVARRAALGAGEDLPQGEREWCPSCGSRVSCFSHCPHAVTGQERGQDG